MRRPLLLTLVALGILVSLIGSTGLFAALTDTARTGTNSVDSAALASSADIQLATATSSGTGIACGTFSENLTTAFFTASDVEAGYTDFRYFCIMNVGSEPVAIAASVDELLDIDTLCTGDESEHGDATCGVYQLGELSSVLDVSYVVIDCSTETPSFAGAGSLRDNATTAATLATALAAGDSACYAVVIEYPTGETTTAIQQAQSDTVTWRFKFTAQA